MHTLPVVPNFLLLSFGPQPNLAENSWRWRLLFMKSCLRGIVKSGNQSGQIEK